MLCYNYKSLTLKKIASNLLFIQQMIGYTVPDSERGKRTIPVFMDSPSSVGDQYWTNKIHSYITISAERKQGRGIATVDSLNSYVVWPEKALLRGKDKSVYGIY